MTYTLEQLTFDLVPDGLHKPDETAEVIDEFTANDVYRQTYRMVYNEWPRTDLGKHWKAATANAKKASMDFRTFCLFHIAGYAVTHEFTPFFTSSLTGSKAHEKIDGYRQACLRKFGVADGKALGLMLNIDLYDIDDEMFRSEVRFGRFIVGRGTCSDADLVYAYDFDEISFSPYWLAIEQTYYELVFTPYIEKVRTVAHWEKKTLGTDAQLRHRHLVTQVRSGLKRRSHLLSTILASRSRIMPKAAKFVLDQHGFDRQARISDDALITCARTFWTSVAEARPK